MGIQIARSMSQLRSALIMGVLQMWRNRKIPGSFHFTHCFSYCLDAGITLRRTRNIHSCLRQNNLCLRHSHTLYCKSCIRCDLQSLRIRKPDILCRMNHHSSCDKGNAFAGIQHSCQIIHGCIRIRSAHAFDKSGNRIIVIIPGFIVTQHAALDTFLCDLQGQMNLPVCRTLRCHDAKLYGI